MATGEDVLTKEESRAFISKGSDRLIYLASPFTHPDKEVEKDRYEKTIKALYILSKWREVVVYSPIVHWYEVAARHNMKTDCHTWERISFGMLRRCEEFWILCLEGWHLSKGIRDEQRQATLNFLEKRYLRFTIGYADLRLSDWDPDLRLSDWVE